MSVRSKEGHREKQVETKNQTPNKGHINKINTNHFKGKKKKNKLNHRTKCMGITSKINLL